MANIIAKNGRLIGTIIPDLTIEECTNDTWEITQHPIQQGASISDHKFRKPVSLKLTIMQSGNEQSDLQNKYKALLDLQSQDTLFDVTTPKRIYTNMQIKVLNITTNKETENILSVTIELQEVITVSVSVTTVPPRANQKNAGKTGVTQNVGIKNATPLPENSQKVSALKGLFG